MLFSMTNAEAQAVLWALAHAKPIADKAFPNSCLVAQIEGLTERLGRIAMSEQASQPEEPTAEQVWRFAERLLAMGGVPGRFGH